MEESHLSLSRVRFRWAQNGSSDVGTNEIVDENKK